MMTRKFLLMCVGSCLIMFAQQERTVLCHVPGGDLSKSLTIETGNPSAHIDPIQGNAPGHEADFLGPCDVVVPPEPPPESLNN